MLDIPLSISYIEIGILIGVWLNTTINVYNFMKGQPVARYDVSFVIDTDIETAGQQPWWLFLGDNPMPMEWLEYVMVRDLNPEEQVLDVEFMPNTINVIDMVQKPEPPKPILKLVVNNDDKESEETEEPKSDS